MTRLEQYETRTSKALTALAAIFFLVYGIPIVWPDLPRGVISAMQVANVTVWALFAVDLAIRVAMARRRASYLLHHPIDVLTVLLPMLRPLRVLRVFAAGHSLLTRGGGLLRTGQAVLVSAAVLVLIGALSILDAERGTPGSNITSFSDALWWAMTTVTTVGYGDQYPVSGMGRVVAAALMIVGISVLGVVTASVAAYFVTSDDGPEGTDPAGPGAQLRELSALHADGVLTDAEYSAAKARILEHWVMPGA
ncbi:ion channel [Actinotalea sp. K2]|uniref:ion channel n=1 Tax=Actinotalea sp. K2 TaxID=2939438 RepID=UPI002018355B|nr:ion channel [Actinotalea sp. K2]MCL3860358.1 ion channel [Actinotalea sp. K2]